MSTSRARRQTIACGTALALLAFLGCKKAITTPLTAAALTIVQGNNQSVQAGALLLPIPVVMRVTDATGAGLPAIPITFVIGDGGGSVSPASAISDTKGEVSVKWTLGPGVAGQSLNASAPGLNAVRVNAVAILTDNIIIAQGNNQTAKVGATLTNSIVVRVVGIGNVPISGVAVGFQVIGGGGGITPQSAITNVLGEATAKWSLGNVSGANTAIVSASTLTPAILTATGIP